MEASALRRSTSRMPGRKPAPAFRLPGWPRRVNGLPNCARARDTVGTLDACGERASVSAAMDRYAARDDTAFSQLYEHLAPKIYRFLVRQTQDVARAEDLLQQTMLQFHAQRRRFISGADVLP